jgi:5'-deoxynucleotidase YfbR-like HD superfamily hydrolase
MLGGFLMSINREQIEKFWEEKSPSSKSNLNELIRNNSITPFIGAGMSIPYGLPSWTTFLNQLIDNLVSADKKKICKKLLREGKYLEAASEIDCDLNNSVSLKVSTTYSNPKINQSLENYIAILKSKGITNFVTTNYDEIIELLDKKTNDPHLRCYLPEGGDISMTYQEAGRAGLPRLLKLHGTCSNLKSIVLTKQQYNRCYGKKSVMNSILKDLWKNNTLLFLGCSLHKDPLIEHLYSLAGKNSDVFHYAILEYPSDEKQLKHRDQWLTKLHIKPIWFPTKAFDSINIILSMICSNNNATNEIIAESSLCDKGIDRISFEYLDPIAHKAFTQQKEKKLFEAILYQANPSIKTNLNTLSAHLRSSSGTMLVKGFPGTGKSTLLSLLYLVTRQQAQDMHKDELHFLIDIHHYDTLNSKRAKSLLCTHLREAQTYFAKSNKIILFVDGINYYKRMHNQLEDILLSKIEEWRNNPIIKDKLSIVFAVGKMDDEISNFRPFLHNSPVLPSHIDYQIELNYLNSNKYGMMIRKLAELNGILPPKGDKRNSFIDRFSTYWKKVSGSFSEFRTAYFLINAYETHYRDRLFDLPVGELFYRYYSKEFKGTQLSVKNAALKIAHFMLSVEFKASSPSVPHYVYKSPTVRDFFLAYHYVKAIESKNLDELNLFNLIFTLRINRYVVSLINRTSKFECSIVDKCISLYDQLSLPQKNQIVYLLGRVESNCAKDKATGFLLEQFKNEKDHVSNYNSDQEMMIFRSIGISLLYLDNTDVLDDFLILLIYNPRMSRVNRNFHVQYYDKNKSRLDEELHISNNDCCSSGQLLDLYHHLRTSVHSLEPLRYVSIVTMLNIVVYNHYLNNVGKHSDFNPENFDELLEELCNDTNIRNTVVKNYIRDVRDYIASPNVYADIVDDVYGLKDIVRKGWTKRERQVKNPENVPSHCWSACMLAEMYLTKDLQDCSFASNEEKTKYSSYYDKGHILELLLIHDLAETYIGDITPDAKSYEKKGEQEVAIFKQMRVLSSFPKLGSFKNLGDLGEEYLEGKTFNAQIANDFDQLDALVQVYVYRDRFPVETRVKVKDEWIKYVDEKLKTTLGRNVFAFVQEFLLNYGY